MKTVNVIEAIFFAALEKNDAGERAAYLDKACVGDADLRRCVEKLLSAQPKVGDFMQAPADGLPQTTETPPSDERPGIVIGPYKLLHDIGEGGMGTVWMAEQSEPVKRRVALKVIKPGMDSRQVLARFEAERQALALMDHPNIAKVLDAGATANGRPYFVMELVKGQPITEFCDKNRLTPRERLELFVPVCHAIQHAHQKGVIHRDIKPTNVLVALYDGKPVPKVIDFGVAKATADPLTDKTLFTRHGQVVGTFEYMSPEQATLDQVDVDTRSDVYSLGVLLYELLTGTTPLEKERLRQAGLAEVLRLIREEEPPKPSTRLTSTPGLLATAAAFRKCESQKLPRVVRGELDWIVMKALEKDRDRRFVTPNGLARDIERYLKGEEVTACPPTLAYRFRKWAGKHRVAFATTSAIAAALLIGTVLSSWQAVRATRAEGAIADEQTKTTAALNASQQDRQELEIRLGEIQAKNEQIRRDQEERRSLYYRGDMREIPDLWEAGSTAEARRMLARQPEDLRRFEWHFWDRKMHSEAEPPFTLPDVDAPGPARGRVQWWFSEDGSRVVRVTTSPPGFGGPAGLERVPGTLQVWDVATRKLLLRHTLAEDEDEDGSAIANLALSRDGKIVLVTGIMVAKDQATTGDSRPSPDGWVRVLEVESGKELFNSRKEMSDGRFSTVGHLSRDGRKLVTTEVSNPGAEPRFTRIKVWDLGAAEKRPLVLDGAFVRGFSPDGSRLLGGGMEDGKKPKHKLWDTATGREIPGYELPFDQFGGSIGSAQFGKVIGFSPDGSLLAEVTSKRAGPEGASIPQLKRTLHVHDANTGKEVFPPVDLGIVSQFAQFSVPVFTNDGSRVAVSRSVRAGLTNASEHWEWLVFDAKSGKPVTSFDDPHGASGFSRGSRMFSDDGSQFLCAVENMVYTFDSTKGQAVHTLRGNENPIADMVAVPNGRLRTVETGGTIREWDLRPVEPVRTAFVEERRPRGSGPVGGTPLFVNPQRSAFSADGAWIARYISALDQDEPAESVRVWDAAGTATPIELTPPPRISPKGDGVNGGIRLRFPQLSADGKRLALFRGEIKPPSTSKQEKVDPTPALPPDVTVWDVASRKMLFHRELQPLGGVGPAINQVRLSPDGAAIALLERVEAKATVTSTVRFLDVVTGREGPKIDVDDSVVGFSLSPDGRRIVVGIGTIGPQIERPLRMRQVAVFDVGTGERISTIEADALAAPNGISYAAIGGGLAWSLDGSRLAFADAVGSRIHLIDVTTGKRVQTLEASNRGGSIRVGPGGSQLTFSPDGRRIACVVSQRVDRPQTVNVLDTDSGRQVVSLPLPPGRPLNGETLRFSPDGHRLIHFGLISAFSDGPPAPAVLGSHVQVTTWDATPRPEPKQP